MTGKLWAIPDIHGRLDLLDALINSLAHDGLDLVCDKLIFLGDMIDRGPNSWGVVQKIRSLQRAYPENVVVLAGNHEWLCIEAYLYKETWNWHMNGGGATAMSWPGKEVDEESVRWMSRLPLFHEEPGFFFSHAPLPKEKDRRPDLQGKPFSKDELTWTYHQHEQAKCRDMLPETVGVCGHVHRLRYGEKSPRLYPHYIFADAGCGCDPRAPLVAIEVQSRQLVYSHPKIEKSGFEEVSL